VGDHGVFLGLLAAVAALSAVARRYRLQTPIVLVLAGTAAGLVPWVPRVALDPEVVLTLVLPPLLYYAALNTSMRDFRANLQPIALLSVGLVLVTAAAVAAVTVALVPALPLAAAFALGAIVAPPDAVAAVAVGREVGMPRRLLAILEGESLVNDATALVSFRIAVAAVGAAAVTFADAAAQFLLASAVGIGVGLALAAAIAFVRRRLDDPPVENSLSLLTPFAAFLPAEALHGSGVLAVVVTGLHLGQRSPVLLSSATRLEVHALWRMITYLLEGVVFVLVGLQFPAIVAGGAREHGPGALAAYAAAVVLTVVVVRFAWVWLSLGLPHQVGVGTARVRDWRGGVVVSWAGMRGVVSLAAALSLPVGFPERDLLLFLTAAVILATLVVQGTTLPWLVRRLGLAGGADRAEELQREEAVADHHIARAALGLLERLAGERDLPDELVAEQRRHLEERIRRAHSTLGGCPGEDEYRHAPVDRPQSLSPPELAAIGQWLRTTLIEAERAELLRLAQAGDVSHEAQRDLERMLDLVQVSFR
jgi:Na+/H+ antiporter